MSDQVPSGLMPCSADQGLGYRVWGVGCGISADSTGCRSFSTGCRSFSILALRGCWPFSTRTRAFSYGPRPRGGLFLMGEVPLYGRGGASRECRVHVPHVQGYLAHKNRVATLADLSGRPSSTTASVGVHAKRQWCNPYIAYPQYGTNPNVARWARPQRQNP